MNLGSLVCLRICPKYSNRKINTRRDLFADFITRYRRNCHIPWFSINLFPIKYFYRSIVTTGSLCGTISFQMLFNVSTVNEKYHRIVTIESKRYSIIRNRRWVDNTLIGNITWLKFSMPFDKNCIKSTRLFCRIRDILVSSNMTRNNNFNLIYLLL